MLKLIQSEPVAFQFVIQTGLLMVMAFGVHLTQTQMAAVLTFTGAVLSLWTRQNVTANPNVATPNLPPAPPKP